MPIIDVEVTDEDLRNQRRGWLSECAFALALRRHIDTDLKVLVFLTTVEVSGKSDDDGRLLVIHHGKEEICQYLLACARGEGRPRSFPLDIPARFLSSPTQLK